MKVALSVFLLVFAANVSLAQESFLEKLKGYDLAQVIDPDSIGDDSLEKVEAPESLGYIGNDYERFRIHFTSFKKDPKNPLLYNVKGKTRVKDNICTFAGTFTVVSAEFDNTLEDFMDTDYKGLGIVCDVVIYEDKLQKGSGIIRGTLITDAFFDNKNKLIYNALMLMSDGFRNNQFTGTWTSYKNGISKKCNWGDFRIPESNDLDIGAGEFSVLEKYKNKGWESYYDAYCCDPDLPKTKAARKKEEEKWWL
ncbi:hypothetical protein HYN59_00060 [Flavobacterium album]|uniref:Uncharacterized protein n=1 Tax=Flavobacterium album TaxID=2175091 RepID=A0A2S1QT94_9FLAO|nr:hypothetical protein [Flavobacterium album]AWH83604.1 hypothetical protein HYN59_00060 [Flavobacterium album]